jgi:WD40 repeat protein
MSDPVPTATAQPAPATPPDRQNRLMGRDYRLIISGCVWAILVIVLVAVLQSLFKEWYALHALRSYRELTRLDTIEATRILSQEADLGHLLADRAQPDGVPTLFIDLATGLRGPEGRAQLERDLAAAAPGPDRVNRLAGLEYGHADSLGHILADADAPMDAWLDAVHAAALVDAYTAIDFSRLINGPYVNLFPGRKEIDAKIRERFPNYLNRLLYEQDEEADPATGAIRTKSSEARAFLDAFLAENPQIYKAKARAKWQAPFEATVMAQFKRRDISLAYKRLVRAGAESRRTRLDGGGWAFVNRFLADRYLSNPTNLSPASGGADAGLLPAHAGPALALARSPTTGDFATAGFDNLIRVWPADLAAPARTLEGHTFGVMAIAWSPDGARLASCGLDATVCIWDAVTLQRIAQFPAATCRASAIAFAPDGRYLAMSGSEGAVRLLDAASGAEIRRLKGLRGEVTSLAFSPGGRYIVAGSRDPSIRVWDLRGGDAGVDAPAAALPEQINTLTLVHKSNVWSVAVSPDGQHLATASDDELVRIYDLRQESTRAVTLKGHRLPVVAVAWSPDSQSIASIGNDGRAIIWSASDGEPRSMHRFGAEAAAAAFSADGKRLLVACDDGRLLQWTIVDGAVESRTFSQWVVDSFSQ